MPHWAKLMIKGPRLPTNGKWFETLAFTSHLICVYLHISTNASKCQWLQTTLLCYKRYCTYAPGAILWW